MGKVIIGISTISEGLANGNFFRTFAAWTIFEKSENVLTVLATSTYLFLGSRYNL